MKFSKFAVFAILSFIAITLTACSGGASKIAPPPPASTIQLSGSWEIEIPRGSTTQYVEANITQSNLNVTASQVQTYTLTGNQYSYCYPSDTQSLSATLSADTFGSTLAGTITTCSGVSGFTVPVSNNTILNGNILSGGTFSAQATKSLSGSYSGTLTVFGTSEAVAITLTETPTYTLTASGTAGSGNVSLTGTVVGNVVIATGTADSQPVSLYAWDSSGLLYVLDANTGDYLGTLTAVKQ